MVGNDDTGEAMWLLGEAVPPVWCCKLPVMPITCGVEGGRFRWRPMVKVSDETDLERLRATEYFRWHRDRTSSDTDTSAVKYATFSGVTWKYSTVQWTVQCPSNSNFYNHKNPRSYIQDTVHEKKTGILGLLHRKDIKNRTVVYIWWKSSIH